MSDHELAWFRAHTIAYRCGLLDDDDTARYERLRDESSECRAFWAEYTRSDEDDVVLQDEHIPAAMIARWDRVRTTLEGVEREMVARHARECVACRRDLAALGHAADLDGDSAAERRVPAPARSHRRHRSAWIAAIAAAAALAAATTLFVLEFGARGVRAAGPGGLVPWVEPQLTRGDVRALTIPAGTRRVALAITIPATWMPERPVRFRVHAPDGRTLLDAGAVPGELTDGRCMLLVDATTDLDSGLYRVELLGTAADGLEAVAEAVFELRVAPPSSR